MVIFISLRVSEVCRFRSDELGRGGQLQPLRPMSPHVPGSPPCCIPATHPKCRSSCRMIAPRSGLRWRLYRTSYSRILRTLALDCYARRRSMAPRTTAATEKSYCQPQWERDWPGRVQRAPLAFRSVRFVCSSRLWDGRSWSSDCTDSSRRRLHSWRRGCLRYTWFWPGDIGCRPHGAFSGSWDRPTWWCQWNSKESCLEFCLKGQATWQARESKVEDVQGQWMRRGVGMHDIEHWQPLLGPRLHTQNDRESGDATHVPMDEHRKE